MNTIWGKDRSNPLHKSYSWQVEKQYKPKRLKLEPQILTTVPYCSLRARNLWAFQSEIQFLSLRTPPVPISFPFGRKLSTDRLSSLMSLISLHFPAASQTQCPLQQDCRQLSPVSPAFVWGQGTGNVIMKSEDGEEK